MSLPPSMEVVAVAPSKINFDSIRRSQHVDCVFTILEGRGSDDIF